MNAWFSDYLMLALRLDRHVPGIVDAYYGPPELKARADEEKAPMPVDGLLHESNRLLDGLSGLSVSQPRKDYLSGQLQAIHLLLRKAGGESVPFAEEVRVCFQVLPQRVDESVFREAATTLDTVLPGHGPVRDRVIAWEKSLHVAGGRVGPAIAVLESELRKRTAARFPLPAGESVEFCTVTNRPWSGYNWYLGGCRSRVDINIDLPVKGHSLPHLIAHEAYPGHHTEHAIKDALLWQAEGYPEFTVLLANTPDCLISEGLANLGLEFLVPLKERASWLGETYLGAAGLRADVGAEIVAVTRASRQLRAVSGNAAFMLHEDGRPAQEVSDYLCLYGLKTSEEAAKTIGFLTDSLWRAYIFTYYYGEDLLRTWLDRVGWAPGFRRLVSEPLVPERLVQGAYG